MAVKAIEITECTRAHLLSLQIWNFFVLLFDSDQAIDQVTAAADKVTAAAEQVC